MSRALQLQEAWGLYKTRQLDEALRRFQEALDRDEHEAEALYGLGLVDYARGDVVAAERTLDAARRSDVTWGAPSYYLGQLAERAGDQREARRRYAEAIAADPDNAAAIDALRRLMGGITGAAVPAAAGRADAAVAQQGPPREPKRRDTIVGLVEGVSRRTEPYGNRPYGLTVLEIRLRRYVDGSLGDLFGFHMRATRLSGAIEKGDWIEIGDVEVKRDGSNRVKECFNLSAEQLVKASVSVFH